jgi:hypothetical protein
MSDAIPVGTPVDKSIVLKKRQNELNEESDAIDQHKYQEVAGSINYAAIATRSDIKCIRHARKIFSRPFIKPPGCC